MIKRLIAIAALATMSAAFVCGCAGRPVTVAPPEKNGHKLVWNDEFDGNSLDLKSWDYQRGTRDVYGEHSGPQNWGNNELQYYAEDNLSVADGALKITAKRESVGGMNYTSSRILTRDKKSFTFGYVEARIKLPAVSGLWPAFWMLPQCGDDGANEYGTWAANGEIDIMEAKGRVPDKVATTLHFGGNWPQNTYLTHESTLSEGIDEWHVYAIDWRAEYIAWYVDETEVYRLTNDKWYSVSARDNPSAPFDVPFYIIFNLAVGGNFDGGIAPDDDFTEASMFVDYVRVYD